MSVQVQRTSDSRIERAMTGLFAIESMGGSIFRVHSSSGNTYSVDVDEGRCTCEDNSKGNAYCKHLLVCQIRRPERHFDGEVSE